MAKRSRCECGRVKSQFARDCNRCAERKHREYQEVAQRIVAGGACPDCGAPLRRNLALTGWWQCSQYGAVGFRADSSKPACGFQIFLQQ